MLCDYRIRKVDLEDMGAFTSLCLEHAAFEETAISFSPPDEGRLATALFGEPAQLWALVMEAGDSTLLAGYATYTIDFSTWRAARYLHLDCLYLRPRFRRLGLGVQMMARIREEALSNGCLEVEWQTPDWNEPAKRFYSRLGATALDKCRFIWHLSAPGGCGKAPRGL